jgi:transcription elongation factor Elf1
MAQQTAQTVGRESEMGLARRMLCLFGKHHRNGNKVAKRGSVYSAPCMHCGRRLEKYSKNEAWKPV